MTESALCLRDVSKRYRHFHLDRIDLDVRAGSITGLIGANGSGKSTLFHIVMGLVRPDGGEVRVLGRPMPRSQIEVKREVGFVSADMSLHPNASLGWHARLVRSFHPGWDQGRACELADRLDLRWEQKAGEFSRGQRIKAMFLLALCRRPHLLLLDEPTAGLDPMSRTDLLRELRRLAAAEILTALFATHLLDDLDAADEVVLLARGRVADVGSGRAAAARLTARAQGVGAGGA
jgi:ABC-2 type transport system ATP-binding protein